MSENISTLKVVIASEQNIVSAGFGSIIKTAFKASVIHFSTNSQDFVSIVSGSQPDIILVDCKIVEALIAKNNEAFNEILNKHKTLLFTDDNRQAIYDLHKLPIQGFITTYSTEKEINEAVNIIVRGGKYFCQKVIQVLIEMSMQRGSQKQLQPHENLTDREMEIFMLVTQGKSAKEISDALFLSTHTVYTHRKNILKKLACKSATELINYAHAKGLMEG